MKEIDDELRNALRRRPPPAGLAERVLRRAAVEHAARAGHAAETPSIVAPLASRPFVRWAAAAAIVAAVGGGMQYRHVEKARAERVAGEAAKRQVIEALRITAEKLQVVQAAVQEAGS